MAEVRIRVPKTIKPGETTVVLLTGTGLKATQRIGELMG